MCVRCEVPGGARADRQEADGAVHEGPGLPAEGGGWTLSDLLLFPSGPNKSSQEHYYTD